MLSMMDNLGMDNLGMEYALKLAEKSPTTPPPIQGEKPEWCKCGNCRDMPKSKNICCRKANCVTKSDEFNLHCLDYRFLTARTENTFFKDPKAINAMYRRTAYRQWARLLVRDKERREHHTSCVLAAIRNRFPSPDGEYVGFKEKSPQEKP